MKDQLHMKMDVADECALEIVRRFLRSRQSVYVRSDRQAAALYAIHTVAETIIKEKALEQAETATSVGPAPGGVSTTGADSPALLAGAATGHTTSGVPDQPRLVNAVGQGDGGRGRQPRRHDG